MRIQSIAEKLRIIIKRIVSLIEEGYPGWHGIGYKHPKAGYICGIFPFKNMVKLSFEYGVFLKTHKDILVTGSSKGSKVRYLEIRDEKDIKEDIIKELINESIDLRGGNSLKWI